MGQLRLLACRIHSEQRNIRGFLKTSRMLDYYWILDPLDSKQCWWSAFAYYEMGLGAHKIVDQPDVIILTLGDTILALCVAICQSETVCILAFYMLSREWRWRTQEAMPCRGLFTLWHCIFINLFWFPVNIKLRSKDSRNMYVTSSCFLWTGFHNFNLTSPEAEFRFGKIGKFASFRYFAHTAKPS